MNDNNTSHKSGERIAKAIARAGLASRREAEGWIAAGRVAVNGAVIGSPACNVTAQDSVTVDGKPLPARERTRLFLYNKPRGLLTAHTDPRGRPTIFEHLPKSLPRLISVGRLDFNTEGLLLLTNDGALARVLELPATGWLRRYRVRAHGSVTQAQLDGLRQGVTVGGIHYGAIEAALERVQGSNLWLTFAMREGKNREVRNVLGDLGLMVTRLIRVSFGPFQVGELAEGAVEEVPTRVLREQLGARLVALSGVDFSAPIAAPPSPPPQMHDDTRERERPTPTSQKSTNHSRHAPAEERPSKKPMRDDTQGTTRPKPARRQSTSHSWRTREEERPNKKLRRKFRGSRRDDETPRQRPAGAPRADVTKDGKGRPVLVERYGQAPPKERHDERPGKHAPNRGRHGRGRAPDRASGARPRQPRGRR
jgi:23S rRNA pseudouridine2605 synthase